MTEILNWTGGLRAVDSAYGWDDSIIMIDDRGALPDTGALGILDQPPAVHRVGCSTRNRQERSRQQ